MNLSAQIDSAVFLPPAVSPAVSTFTAYPIVCALVRGGAIAAGASPFRHAADTKLPECERKSLGKSARRHVS
jgi:hypothetical protein